MRLRGLRVVKWLGTVSAVGVCTQCATNFNVPIDMLKQRVAAQESLRTQFAEHTCKRLDSSENAVRIVREATKMK